MQILTGLTIHYMNFAIIRQLTSKLGFAKNGKALSESISCISWAFIESRLTFNPQICHFA